MVESVECFDAELKGLRLRQTHVFEKRYIVVVHSRTVEEAAARGAGRAQGVLGELRCVKIRAAIAGITIQVEWTAQIVGLVYSEVVDAVRLRAEQRVVAEVDQRRRKPRAESRDPG